MVEKKGKPLSVLMQEDLPAINTVLAKGDRVEIGPGPNGTVKIMHVKREYLKTRR